MKRVLFSPIGTADPMTVLGDGPMLHIVRHYRPDSIVLFLSPKMAKYQNSDKRYTRAIEDCCGTLGINIPEIKLVESNHSEVHRFDYYIEEFENVLDDLRAGDGRLEIIANVSSGTPGMQQALVSLGAFGRLRLKLLQVSTPRADANQAGDREDPDNYDYDALWAHNPDNQMDSRCRICQIETPNFATRLLKKKVAALIEQYDYRAALELVDEDSGIDSDVRTLIEATAYRFDLDGERAASAFEGDFAAKNRIGLNLENQLFEYLSTLEVRYLQGHFADFVRALTPALTETMLNILDEVLPREQYLTDESLKSKDYNFDRVKLERNEDLFVFLKDKCHVNFRDFKKPFVTNDHLMKMLDQYYPTKKGNKKARIKRLRNFEKSIRNDLSHQITCMAQVFIEKKGGMSFQSVLDTLFGLNGVQRGLYKRINKAILGKLQ